MTTFDALVSISQTLMRARGEWQGGATGFLEIELAVNDAASAIRGEDYPDLVTLAHIQAAITELKRRATPTVQYGT